MVNGKVLSYDLCKQTSICDALNVPKLVVMWLLDCWWGEELEDIKGNELGPSTLMSFIIGSAATGIVIVFKNKNLLPLQNAMGGL